MSANDPKTQMILIQQALNQALGHLQAGKLDQARVICQHILSQHPNHLRALYMLGVIAQQKGELSAAADLFRRAIAADPSEPSFYNSLGITLTDQRRPVQAIEAFRTLLKLKPNNAEAHNNLGIALKAAGQLQEAAEAYRRALQIKPDYAQAHNNLGNVLDALGQHEQAIDEFRIAMQLNPNYPEAHYNLGLAFKQINLIQQAMDEFRLAVKLKPDYIEAHNNLGNLLALQDQIQEAITEYRLALKLKPDFAQAHFNLGNLLGQQHQIEESINEYRVAIEYKPDLAEAHNNLGNAYKDQGLIDQALAAYRAALKISPHQNQVLSNLIHTMHYHSECSAGAIKTELVEWNRRHAEPHKKFIQQHPKAKTSPTGGDSDRGDPERRLKIGYVSPDFRNHSVAFFLQGLFAAHDPAEVEIFCYADLIKSDDTTNRLRSLAHHWRDITNYKDPQVADLVRLDRIDILVDLAGHTANNRLLLFACKPSPLQLAYLGYPDTTGLEAIDYRFTDAYADPAGEDESFYSEALIRLPNTFLCYQPPDAAPPVGSLPAANRSGVVTFGCLNALPKINAKLVELWAQILKRRPESRMLIKNSSLADPGAQSHLLQLFAACGIMSGRLELRGWSVTSAEHLQFHHQLDVVLDTFPYNGTTTTCEALWMGVPVVSLAGQTHMSRVGRSLLSNVGLPELIARTPEEYVDIAVKITGDLPRLTEFRRTLRQRMKDSPLMDAKRFTKNIEAAYREMFRKWCRGCAEKVES
jgi:protein O-GlcNAc transferase